LGTHDAHGLKSRIKEKIIRYSSSKGNLYRRYFRKLHATNTNKSYHAVITHGIH